MTKPRYRRHGAWSATLTDEQVATVKRIRAYHNSVRDSNSWQRQVKTGWRVFMEPTTLPARYVELRHYMHGGRIARWVIEKDGTVSKWNRLSAEKALVPTPEGWYE